MRRIIVGIVFAMLIMSTTSYAKEKIFVMDVLDQGEVEMMASLETQKIHDVREMLALAKQMEVDSARDYNIWANECSANNDAASKQVFEGLIDDEERHADQYDNEMVAIDKFGERYLALQSIERSKSMSGGIAEG